MSATALSSDRSEDAVRIDHIRLLENVKTLACAVQGDLAVALDASQRRLQAEAGEPVERQGRGVAAQVALARRESPHRGQALLGMAKTLAAEMPHTRARLADGTISEMAAMSLVKETACLGLDDRRTVDVQLCSDPDTLTGWGSRRIADEARKRAQTLDPAAAVKRAEKARSERTVTLRPAPGEMTYLTALLPVEQGVACYAALVAAASTANTVDDDTGEIVFPRSRAQVMADTLVERITGQQYASDVPIRVNLIVSDETLLNDGDEPATVGDQTIPASLARRVVADAAQAELRRVYASPTTGQLVGLESRSRLFPAALADFIDIRDQRCRTPYCDAPIPHHDHIRAYESGGPTTSNNGQGLCAGCNYAKQAPDWRASPGDTRRDSRHIVTTETLTGHRYTSWSKALPAPLPLMI